MATSLHSPPRLQGDSAVSLSQICLLLPLLSPAPSCPPRHPTPPHPRLPRAGGSSLSLPTCQFGAFCDGRNFSSTFLPDTYT